MREGSKHLRRLGFAAALLLAAAAAAAQDLLLLLFARIADVEADQESVELRFGKRIGAVQLDRILRRDHHKRLDEREGLAFHRDLPLLHRFQQRRLGFWRRAVDLVGEQ